jgi:hypothetical protein
MNGAFLVDSETVRRRSFALDAIGETFRVGVGEYLAGGLVS